MKITDEMLKDAIGLQVEFHYHSIHAIGTIVGRADEDRYSIRIEKRLPGSSEHGHNDNSHRDNNPNFQYWNVPPFSKYILDIIGNADNEGNYLLFRDMV